MSDQDDRARHRSVEDILDEFLHRLDRGEEPTVAEYVERFPEMAVELRLLLSIVLGMDDMASERMMDPPASEDGAPPR